MTLRFCNLPVRAFYSFVLFFLALGGALTASGARASSCEELKSNLKFEVSEVPKSIAAGQRFQVSIIQRLAMPDSHANWKSFMIVAGFRNAIEGSARISEALLLRYNGKNTNASEPMTFVVTPHMSGNYESSALMIAQSSETLRCVIELQKFGKKVLRVLNTPENADIMPPQVNDFEFAQSTVLNSDEVVLSFRVSDKNAICTKALLKEGRCADNWHIEFANLNDPNIKLNAWPAVELIQGDLYQVKFKFEKTEQERLTIPAGPYEVVTFNITDVAGNVFQIGAGPKPKLQITDNP